MRQFLDQPWHQFIEGFRITQLRRAVATPEALKALSHLDVIPDSVIALSAEPRLFRSVTPSFLAEVARDDGGTGEEGAMALLREALQMHGHLEPGKVVRVESMARLREWHDDLRRDYDRWVESRAETRKFGPPPVPGLPGVIEPLESARALVLESRAQSNCAASYADRVREGGVYLYRVLQPERATLSLVRSGSSGWEMGELKASYNRPVSESTSELVEQWLRDWSLAA